MVMLNILAVIELVPAEVVYVCPGGQLKVTCKSNSSLIEWNVTVPLYQRSWIRTLSYIGTAQRTTPIQIDETTMFNISRSLDETMPLPLISVILSDNVTASVNKTIISCTGYDNLFNELIMNTLTTQVHIIDSEPRVPNFSRFELNYSLIRYSNTVCLIL